MARVPYIVDGRMFAKKIKHSAQLINWRSDVSICCPNCSCKIDNSYMQQDWPGLPLGVKFDPTDQELLKHLQAKSGCGNERLHPFIDDFISTLDGNSGICYTHPEKLPGVRKDGSCIHFFHKTVKAYATGTRKRRKIQNEDDPAAEDLRWHKTGKTRAVLDNGGQMGCKKIMVLYVTPAKGVKAEKTNWVMHQYHLGTEEDEKDNEYVISKVFFQHQAKQEEAGSSKTGPLTPSSATTPPRPLKQNACSADEKEHDWLLPNMLCDEHLSPDAVNYSSPLRVGDQITESSREHEMLNTSVKLNASANENEEERHLHPPNSEVAEPVSEKKLLEPNEERDCLSETFLPDVSLDSQLFGESQFFADSEEMLQNALFCAETLNGTSNQETKEEEQGVAPWPEGGRVIADEDDDADEGRTPASPKQNVTTFPEGHVIGGGDNIQDVPRPVSPSLSNIYVDSLPEIQFNESQFSSQESLSGWIKKTFNFSENDSQGVMDDNIMQDSQFI